MSDDKVRVATVRELYARRTGQPALLDRVYVVYCAILLVLLYAVPFLYQAGQLDPVEIRIVEIDGLMGAMIRSAVDRPAAGRAVRRRRIAAGQRIVAESGYGVAQRR